MTDYIAYHSSKLMGHEYWPTENFHFWSRKAESFLRRSIGCRTWVVVSTGDRKSRAYRLAGVFYPSDILPWEDGGISIRGTGTPFRPPFEVTTAPWFRELLKEQNKFSYGFNSIRSEFIVAELVALLASYGGEDVLLPDELAASSALVEGAVRQVSVNRYERNPEARQKCIAHYGCRCLVCGFDFERVYGELGSGFIHVHHVKPLSDIGREYEIDPIADLRPLCANCHAMAHHAAELISVEDLHTLVRNHGSLA